METETNLAPTVVFCIREASLTVKLVVASVDDKLLIREAAIMRLAIIDVVDCMA